MAALKTLIVDDSGIMRKMVMNTLGEANLAEFDFVEAEDGQSALTKLKDSKFDLAFVDWNMPNMTGIDMIKAVRKLERANDDDPLVLVMITSEKTMGKMQEALDVARADHFISKPFTTEEFQVKLKKVIEKAQMLRMRRNRVQVQVAAEAEPAKKGWGWFN
ncbi:response regulator [Limnoglobus roseus]|uniref:Response regulator n=1 Tax=Limnoglobus roseus TaxID=2598579 RepID=A0A5C1ASG4_9BACT|nr:response regulator [Limnoglobus roseus]QEL20582.1 response regulator [Limnoglobus roseus]